MLRTVVSQKQSTLISSLVFMVALFVLAPRCGAEGWPRYLGPTGDSRWAEDGIIAEFPDDGPDVVWRVPVGLGYGGPAVANDRVYLMDYQKRSGEMDFLAGKRDELTGTERVLCFDVETGKLLWSHEYDRDYKISYGSGPRCTPTIADGKVYALGAEGDLTCLDGEKGEVIWSKNLNEVYATETPIWGHSAHPLVDGDMLYCIAGGEGSVAVAMNKDTGEEIWTALSATSQGYCPPTMIEHGGTRQLLIWHPQALNSLEPKTGNVIWSVPLVPSYEMSIAPPRQQGNLIFAAGIVNVSVLLQLSDDGRSVQELWSGTPKTSMHHSFVPPVFDGDNLYGCDSNSGALMAVRVKDGERLWQTTVPTAGENSSGRRGPGNGTAFIVKNGNRYFLMSETGDLIIAELSSDGYTEIDRAHILLPMAKSKAGNRDVLWSHPAFAHRSVFARNDQELVRVSLKR